MARKLGYGGLANTNGARSFAGKTTAAVVNLIFFTAEAFAVPALASEAFSVPALDTEVFSVPAFDTETWNE